MKDNKYYRPILDENTHLGNATKNKGANSSLTFTDDGNKFVRPADWKPVSKGELLLENVATNLITRLLEKGISFAYNRVSNYIENKTEEMRKDRDNKHNNENDYMSKMTDDTICNDKFKNISFQIDEAFNQIFTDKDEITELQLAYFLGMIKGIWLSFEMQESSSETVYEEQRLTLCNKIETLLNTIQKKEEVKIELRELEKWFEMLENCNQTSDKLKSMQLEKIEKQSKG